jgi:hypothetical protein
LFGFLEGCGEQQNITPAGGNSSEIANDVAKELTKEPTKEMTEQPGRAKLTQVSEAAPFQLFTYSKDKITGNDLKTLGGLFMYTDGISKPKRITIDISAVFKFLEVGGWVELTVDNAKPKKFFLTPSKNGHTGRNAGSSLSGIGNWDRVSVSSSGTEISFDISFDDIEYQVAFVPGLGYVLYALDLEKKPSQHGPGPYKPSFGGPPIPVPPKSTWPEDLRPTPPLKEKAVSAPVNIRIGLMATANAKAQASVGFLTAIFDDRVKYLNEALASSNINVLFSISGPIETIGISESNRPLLDLLNELNSPAQVRADVASFRLRNNVDIVVVAVASYGFLGGVSYGSGEGGYARIRGSASESTIVMTVPSLLFGPLLAHEVGHLLGAEHTVNDRQQTSPNSPNFGYVTPTEPIFGSGVALASIMVNTATSCGPGQNPCRVVQSFSDSQKIVKLSPTQPASTVAAAYCALQSPFSASGPCPSLQCLSPKSCPYAVAYGWCANPFNPYVIQKPNPLLQGNDCYASSIFVPAWNKFQTLGENFVADVVTLWKSPRSAEIATFREALKPALSGALSNAIRPALDLMM